MSSKGRETEDGNAVPRAVIHKKILAAAETHPSASIEALADEVKGASISLVERVLDEYGDPSADDADTEESDSSDDQNDDITDGQTVDQPTETMNDAKSYHSASPDLDDLTEQQRDILAEIENDPHATQQDLADAFDVSQATISTHLNAIDGFDWSQRQSFIAEMPTDERPDTDEHPDTDERPDTDATDEAATEADPDTEPDDRPDDGSETTATSSTETTNAVAQSTGEHQPASPEPTTTSTTKETSNPTQPNAAVTDRITELEERLDDKLQALEERLDEQPGATERELGDHLSALERELDELQSQLDDPSKTATPLDDTELAAKAIHACMQADTIDESEELRIIERLTTTPPSSN